jgi:hypothetical protein
MNTTTLPLDILQQSYNKSVELYAQYRRDIDRLYRSEFTDKVESADVIVDYAYHKQLDLESQRRQDFAEYYERRKITTYAVEAVHIGDIDGTKFTEAELKRLAKSLSFNRLNINHAEDPRLAHLPNRRALDYPTNSTLVMTYDPILQGITGFIQMEDSFANDMIKDGRINSVSIEYLSLGGIDGRGIVGTGLALVTSDTKAADKKARIYRA